MLFYIAYGSNLSTLQMGIRCPEAEIVGKTTLEGWRLAFGRHATIEPCEGAETPALVWMITNNDERNLDRYEGYPKYYEKDYLEVTLTPLGGGYSEPVMAMVYIMTDLQKTGMPSAGYVQTIREGYQRFGFDEKGLDMALAEIGSSESKFERLTRWNGKKYVLPQGAGAWRMIAEKLAAYENTGLTPEEIRELRKAK